MLNRPNSCPWLLSLLCLLPPAAIAQLRVVNYNVAQLDGDLAALQTVFAALNQDDRPGFAVAPHIYVFQEVRTADASPPGSSPLLTRLNAAAPPGVSYVRATFTSAPGEDGSGGAQALFYRNDVLSEDPAGHVDIFTGAGRNADRWRLRLDGYDAPSAVFYVFSAHLKAGNSADEAAQRRSGALAIRANADALPAGTHILFCGDWNLYNNAEPAYQAFIAAGRAQADDPFGNGSWAVPPTANAIKHTQAPCLSGCELVGGGMDDRFDFQLATAAMADGRGLSRMNGSYRSFGNDGGHYNLSIDAGGNTYYPGDPARSAALASALRVASDHIPVVCEYQIPARLRATLTSDFGRVIEGAAATVQLSVSNDADVLVPQGADALHFAAVGGGAVLGTAAGDAMALAQSALRDLSIDTSAIGAVAGQVEVTSDSEAVAGSPVQLATQGRVLRHADPSFDPQARVRARTVEVVVTVGEAGPVIMIDVANLAFDEDQARLDLDGVEGDLGAWHIGELPHGIGAGPATIPVWFDSAGPDDAVIETTVGLLWSDEDLAGAASGDLSLTLIAHVRTFVGDVDDDCDVDLSDLASVLAVFGSCISDVSYAAGCDVNNSGCIDLGDLAALLSEFGSDCP